MWHVTRSRCPLIDIVLWSIGLPPDGSATTHASLATSSLDYNLYAVLHGYLSIASFSAR